MFAAGLKGNLYGRQNIYNKRIYKFYTHFTRSIMKYSKSIFVLFISISNLCVQAVSYQIYEADEITPYDGSAIRVNTKLVFIIQSDSVEYWGGGIFLSGNNRGLAQISARGWDPNTMDWGGSRFPAAGPMATVWEYRDSWLAGCDLYTDSIDIQSGEWFIIDYEATGIGDPNIGIYDYSVSWEEPIATTIITQIPSPDLNQDDVVNMFDFSDFSRKWLHTDCQSDEWCEGADLNIDGQVGVLDLMIFCDHWLTGAIYNYPMSGETDNVGESDYGGSDNMQLQGNESQSIVTDEALSYKYLDYFMYSVEGAGNVMLVLYDLMFDDIQMESDCTEVDILLVCRFDPNSQSMIAKGFSSSHANKIGSDFCAEIENNTEGLIFWLDEIWKDASLELKELISKEEWEEFLECIRASYECNN